MLFINIMSSLFKLLKKKKNKQFVFLFFGVFFILILFYFFNNENYKILNSINNNSVDHSNNNSVDHSNNNYVDHSNNNSVDNLIQLKKKERNKEIDSFFKPNNIYENTELTFNDNDNLLNIYEWVKQTPKKCKLYLYYWNKCKFCKQYMETWNQIKQKVLWWNLNSKVVFINVEVTQSGLNVVSSDGWYINSNDLINNVEYVPMVTIEKNGKNEILNEKPTLNNIDKLIN